MSTRQWRDRLSAASQNTERLKDGLPELTEEPYGTETKVEVPPEMRAEFQSTIGELTKAGFKVRRVSDGRRQPRGITLDQSKCREAQRLAAEHLGVLARLPKNIQHRAQGETAIYYINNQPFEWNYSANGFTSVFWEQISEETARGAKIEVLSWPLGTRIYSSGNDAASEERGSL
jgi:hypothetical protein